MSDIYSMYSIYVGNILYSKIILLINIYSDEKPILLLNILHDENLQLPSIPNIYGQLLKPLSNIIHSILHRLTNIYWGNIGYESSKAYASTVDNFSQALNLYQNDDIYSISTIFLRNFLLYTRCFKSIYIVRTLFFFHIVATINWPINFDYHCRYPIYVANVQIRDINLGD
jgi:hypothetical protein